MSPGCPCPRLRPPSPPFCVARPASPPSPARTRCPLDVARVSPKRPAHLALQMALAGLAGMIGASLIGAAAQPMLKAAANLFTFGGGDGELVPHHRTDDLELHQVVSKDETDITAALTHAEFYDPSLQRYRVVFQGDELIEGLPAGISKYPRDKVLELTNRRQTAAERQPCRASARSPP